MRREIVEYVAKCFTYQQVKAEHQRPVGTLQPLPIPEWKWADISMDFIVGLPKSKKGNDSIWVIVDRLSKSAHFLPVRTNYTADTYMRILFERLSNCIEFQRQLYQTKAQPLHPISGRVFRMLLAASYHSVVFSTLR